MINLKIIMYKNKNLIIFPHSPPITGERKKKEKSKKTELTKKQKSGPI